ncbi:hypothetical protein ONE63_009596 [Megalurothrips usitatus]|uniref:PHD-type domain-containing protein n=1 Tax=Megalurothrips usitatus TaxID=439358 RepID=A0AAV7XP89_9NEOP|nr:hypothetical protein ONE63_009596 [Megalurothrips usitatus]
MSREITHCLCGKPPGHNRYMIFCDGCKVWLHATCVGISKTTQLPKEWNCPRCSSAQELAVIKADINSLKNEFHTLKTNFERMVSQDCAGVEGFQKDKYLKEVAGKDRRIKDLENIVSHYKEKEVADIDSLKKEFHTLKTNFDRMVSQDSVGVGGFQKDKFLNDVAEKDRRIKDLENIVSQYKEKEVNLRTELAKVNDLMNDFKDREQTLNEKWMKEVAQREDIIKDLQKIVANHKEEPSLRTGKAAESNSLKGKVCKKRLSLTLKQKNGSQRPLTCPAAVSLQDFDDFDQDVFKPPKSKKCK